MPTTDWTNKCAITDPKGVQLENNCTLFYRGKYTATKIVYD